METTSTSLSRGMGSSSAPRRPVDPFTGLVRAYTRTVRNFAWHAGAPEADLPDVAQEVFIRLKRAADSGLDLSAPLHGWLAVTTFRVTKDWRKLATHANEKVTATGEIDTVDQGLDAEERMARIDVHREVNAALDELKPELRSVLVMHDIGEMRMPAICEELGIPEGTGYSRLRAARAAFREKLIQKRDAGHLGLLPFALWEPEDMLAATRSPPPVPPGFEEHVAARVAGAIAAGLAGPVAGVVGGAAVAGAVQAGFWVTAAQMIAGLVAAMVVGAGLHAVLSARSSGESERATPVAQLEGPRQGGSGAALVASAAVAQITPAQATDVAPGGTASAADDVRRMAPQPVTSEVNERTLLVNARGAIERGDTQVALSLLSRVKSPRLADERDYLRGLTLAAQDGGR